MKNILPDSRAKETKGRIFRGSQSWVPVYCANCGADGGACPEENMTFMFYLCNSCVESHGPIAGTFMTPDDVFRASIKDAMLNDGLTIEQLISVVQEDASPLATLISSRL